MSQFMIITMKLSNLKSCTSKIVARVLIASNMQMMRRRSQTGKT